MVLKVFLYKEINRFKLMACMFEFLKNEKLALS